MAIEQKRGCGYRKIGGYYLVGEGMGVGCDRLPIPIEICSVCGEGIRLGRNYRLIDGTRFLGKNCEKIEAGYSPCHIQGCPVCHSDRLGKCLVMSVGSKFYTPQKFIQEAEAMGVSKRIAHIPKDFELGKMWVLLAHPQASKKASNEGNNEEVDVPAIFYAFKPQRIEKLMKESQATKEVVEELAKRGVTVIKVPDNDLDHQGNVYDDVKKKNKKLDEFEDE